MTSAGSPKSESPRFVTRPAITPTSKPTTIRPRKSSENILAQDVATPPPASTTKARVIRGRIPYDGIWAMDAEIFRSLPRLPRSPVVPQVVESIGHDALRDEQGNERQGQPGEARQSVDGRAFRAPRSTTDCGLASQRIRPEQFFDFLDRQPVKLNSAGAGLGWNAAVHGGLPVVSLALPARLV